MHWHSQKTITILQRAAVASIALVSTGTTARAEILVNGDFEAGNTGFTSTANFVAGGALVKGDYSIRTDPITANGQWCGPDHTSGAGNMLVCDGFSATETIVWRQEADVCPGKTYAFGAWARNLNCFNDFADSVVELRVDGVTIAGPLTLTELFEVWTELTGTFTATGSSVVLELVAAAVTGAGNDFGVDDISLELVEINLTVNGDFEGGNVDFSSAATYVASGPLGAGQYSIRTDPSTGNGQWCADDHTSGTGSMLVCDGIPSGETAVWQQVLPVDSGTYYAFEAWALNLNCFNNFADPVIELRADGQLVAGPVSLTESFGVWNELMGVFQATSSSVLLEVVSTSSASVGDDFAIDDVALSNCIPSLEVTRVGTPPNPAAFLPGVTTGPIVGQTWDPVVSPFLTGATLDFAIVSSGPVQLSLGPATGTLLCGFPFLASFSTPAGTPFAIPLPANCNLVGLDLCVQAVSFSATESKLTNALDITLGNS